MLDTKVVQVTGRGTSVNFVIDDSAPMDKVTQGLQEHLTEHRSLYSRGSITVNVGRRILDREELTRIKEILEKESGVSVARFWCPPEILEQALSESIGFGVTVSAGDAPRRDDAARPRTEETRKPIQWREIDTSGLEQWAAYILEETPPRRQRTLQPPPEPAPSTDPGPTDHAGTVDEAALMEPEIAPEPALVQEAQEVQEAPEGRPEEAEAPQLLPGPGSELVLPVGAPPEAQEEALQEEALDKAPSLAPGVAEPATRPQPRPALPVVRPFDPQRELVGLDRGNEALLIKTTCRSGEVIRYPGDVVVLADVNPGAEIIADGDILVFGNLRGLAHAGAGGDIQATIIALNLDTHRLQIGPYTGVAPKSNKRSKSNTSNPRIALVRRRSIYVAPYIGRFAGYSGGTLYDG
jgi:septum site-determining protein MinC